MMTTVELWNIAAKASGQLIVSDVPPADVEAFYKANTGLVEHSVSIESPGRLTSYADLRNQGIGVNVSFTMP